MESGRIVQGDTLTFTRTGAPWINHQWAAQRLLFQLWDRYGASGLLLLRAALAAAVLGLLVAATRAWGRPAAYLALLWFVLIARNYFLFRPRLFTFLGLALLIWGLPRWRRGRWALPLLFAAWANLHGAFPVGLAYLGWFFLGEVWGDRDWRGVGERAAQGALAAAATLVTPYGLAAWGNIWQTVFSPIFPVSEWMPLHRFPILTRSFWHLALYWGLLGLVLIGGLVFRTRLPLRDLLPALFFLSLSLRYVRFVPIAALVAVPLLVRMGEAAWTAGGPGRAALRRWVPIAAPALVVGLCLVSLGRGTGRAQGLAPDPAYFPVGAVRVLKETGWRGHLFNAYEWGGYLAWELPGSKVFFDGRTATGLFSPDLWREWQAIMDGAPGWEEKLAARGAEGVLIRPRAPLAQTLAPAAGWRRVYEDATAVWYHRQALGE